MAVAGAGGGSAWIEACGVSEGFVVFDDVLTTGSHFKAIKLLLNERFPGMSVNGLFIARTADPDVVDEFEDLSSSDL